MIGIPLLLTVACGLVVLVGTAMLVRGLRRPPRKTAGVALAHGLPTEPAELGLDAEPLDLRLANGHASPGWWIVGEAPDGPLVAICHGFGDSRYGAMSAWAPRVLRWASGVVVCDNRGQGDSTAPFADGSLGEADDLAAIVGQLLDHRPGTAERGVVLYGYSMGANAAIRAAAALGDTAPIVGLIADSPYRRWDGPVHRIFRRHRWPRWPIIPLAGWWLGIGRRWIDTAEVADRLPAGLPVLIVATAGDELIGPDDAPAIAEAARNAGCDAELLALPHGHHLAAYELNETAYAAALDRFFANARARRP